MELLADKVRNRENEILRLHKKLECKCALSIVDGVNMNKLLKDFEKQ